MNPAVRSLLCLATVCALIPLAAAEKTLGVATASGEFMVNNARVTGNATVFEGTVIATGAKSSRVRLGEGRQVGLAANSRARFHEDRLVLDEGVSEVATGGTYEIEAGKLRLSPASGDTMARIARPTASVVEVAALAGSLRVFDARGIQIANVVPGVALSFEPQAGEASAPSSFLGCLMKKEDIFVIYDQAARILVELRGNLNFEDEWGNRVQVVGTTDTAAEPTVGAQIMDVTSLTRYGSGGCEQVAANAGAAVPKPVEQPAAAPGPATPLPPPASTSGTGMSAGTKFAIVAAVGGGAAAGAVLATQSGSDRSN